MKTPKFSATFQKVSRDKYISGWKLVPKSVFHFLTMKWSSALQLRDEYSGNAWIAVVVQCDNLHFTYLLLLQVLYFIKWSLQQQY